MLFDQFGRKHNYLRISLTDACNLRCNYCMPDENLQFMPHAQLMQVDEIEQIARVFVAMGVDKIRLTGGEPLVRKDAAAIITAISQLPVRLSLTTNGARLHDFVACLQKAKVESINISLDTLHRFKFQQITKRDIFNTVWDNIQTAIAHGFKIKINMVVMRGQNEDEILDFVAWTKKQPVHVRFIEFMPFSGNGWNNDSLFSYQEILQVIEKQYPFYRLNDPPEETAKNYALPNHLGTFAVISTMTAPFCAGCNRMRLTADGKMKNCLFSKQEVDILGALRQGQDIEPLIAQCVYEKAAALGGQFAANDSQLDPKQIQNRSMIDIGG